MRASSALVKAWSGPGRPISMNRRAGITTENDDRIEIKISGMYLLVTLTWAVVGFGG